MPTCERVECDRDAEYIAEPYGRPEKLCPFHAYCAPNRRPIRKEGPHGNGNAN